MAYVGYGDNSGCLSKFTNISKSQLNLKLIKVKKIVPDACVMFQEKLVVILDV